MMHHFTLVLSGGVVTDEQCEALYAGGLDDGTISSCEGVSRIDVARDAESLESAVRSAIGNVNSAGLTVAGVEIEAEQFMSQPATN
jgi:hypothetical protein